MYIHTKAILLNEFSELSFPIYRMISSNHFPDIMSLKNVIKIFHNKKEILLADL